MFENAEYMRKSILSESREDDGRARIRILLSSAIRWLESQSQKRTIAIQRSIQWI